jgi:hypothetical protein
MLNNTHQSLRQFLIDVLLVMQARSDGNEIALKRISFAFDLFSEDLEWLESRKGKIWITEKLRKIF